MGGFASTLANSTCSGLLLKSPCRTRCAKLPAVRGAEYPSSTRVILEKSCINQRCFTCAGERAFSARQVQDIGSGFKVVSASMCPWCAHAVLKERALTVRVWAGAELGTAHILA